MPEDNNPSIDTLGPILNTLNSAWTSFWDGNWTSQELYIGIPIVAFLVMLLAMIGWILGRAVWERIRWRFMI